VGRGERLELAMAIRTLQLSRTGSSTWEGSYFSGGGIVADSVPERELEETRWKAVQLVQLGSSSSAVLPPAGHEPGRTSS
jgi:anthranilate synthase component 1/para-aminobenzoate synthetase component 1